MTGSVIVHIMTPQSRNYYKLEDKWKKAEVLDVNYLFPGRPEPIKNYFSLSDKQEKLSEGPEFDEKEESYDDNSNSSIDQSDPFWD